jgi:hypothetical protein
VGRAGSPPRRGAAQPHGTSLERGIGEERRGLFEQRAGAGRPPAEAVGVRGGEQAPAARAVVLAELRGALERRDGRRVPAAQPRPHGGALQLAGHLLARSRARGGEVPGPPVGVGLRWQRGREREVHALALGERRRSVHGRAHERVAERDAGPLDPDEPRRLHRVARRARRPAAPPRAGRGRGRRCRRPRRAAAPSARRAAARGCGRGTRARRSRPPAAARAAARGPRAARR